MKRRNDDYPLPDGWEQDMQELPDVEVMFCLDDVMRLMDELEKENNPTFH